MRYLLLVLLLSGCLTESVQKYDHSLSGNWYFNGSYDWFVVSQAGNTLRGKQIKNSLWDSVCFTGEIIGDSVFINRTFYSRFDPLYFDRIDARIEGDSILKGLFYSDVVRKNSFYASKMK